MLKSALDIKNTEALQLLLEYGADPSIKDEWGDSLLETAITTGKIDFSFYDVLQRSQTHHCMSIPAQFYEHGLISEIACFPNEKISADVTLENKEDNQRENIFLAATSAA